MAYQYRIINGEKQVCGANGVWRKARITKSEKANNASRMNAFEAMCREQGII